MKFRLLRPRQLARMIRETALRRPDEAEEYLDAHPEQWGSIAEADPHDAADILEALGIEAASDLVAELEPTEAAEVLEEMQPGAAAGIIGGLGTDQALELLTAMDADEAADVLGNLDLDERRRLLNGLPRETAAAVRRLLAYPPDSAGGLMTADVAALPIGLSAGEALEALRRLNEDLEDLTYVYVVDDHAILRGVVSFRKLVFARPGTGLDEAMEPHVVSVDPYADREEVAELIQRYNLFAVPVVDDDGTLVGVVGVEQALEAIQEEASEDLVASVGAGIDESVYTPVRRSFRMRMPWILVNLALATIVAFVIENLSDVIDRFTVLAALMPVVALMGGNGGAQSLAVVIRAMAVDQVPSQQVRHVLRREWTITTMMGLIVGVLAGSIAFALSDGDLTIAAVMFLGAFVNLSIAGFVGAGIPILMRRVGYDPALASNIFLTFITDMVGFAGFLLIATLFL